MFTGIVEELGRVRSPGRRLVVGCRTVVDDSDVGASVAVNGVCLTVVERTDGSLSFDLSDETLARSALGSLHEDDGVNLERPVTMLTRLGGHLVQGHVDAVGHVTRIEPDDGGTTMWFEIPPDLAPYLVEKGSIAIDGVSLTVVGLEGNAFCVALIPHTLQRTTLGTKRPGDAVNVEVDVMAKYAESLLRVQVGDPR